MTNEELVLIARIRKPHGVKGELLLQSFTMNDARFKNLDRVFLRDASGTVSEAHVSSVRVTANGVLVKFKEYPDRTAVETLRSYEMLIPLSERPVLEEGHAYYDEIIGMTVIDDETNEKLGEVTDIMELPAGDVIVATLNDGTEHLVTTGGEEIRSIDTKSRVVRVKLLEQY